MDPESGRESVSVGVLISGSPIVRGKMDCGAGTIIVTYLQFIWPNTPLKQEWKAYT